MTCYNILLVSFILSTSNCFLIYCVSFSFYSSFILSISHGLPSRGVLRTWEVIEKGLCNRQVLTTLEVIGKRLFTRHVLISVSQNSWSTFLALKPLMKCIHFIGDFSKFYAKSRFSCLKVLVSQNEATCFESRGFFSCLQDLILREKWHSSRLFLTTAVFLLVSRKPF